MIGFMQVFDDRFQAESGWNILTAEKMPETCRVL
jgi:hypothetical protein